MKYRTIDRCRDAFEVRMMCRNLEVSHSGYYDWREREPSARDRANEQLLGHIRSFHTDSDGVMGAPRIWEELQYAGIPCGKNRVARLMRINHLQGIPQKKRWRKKTCEPRPRGIQNHLARNFNAHEPNTKWVTDITYVDTVEGWLYLSAVKTCIPASSSAGRCESNGVRSCIAASSPSQITDNRGQTTVFLMRI